MARLTCLLTRDKSTHHLLRLTLKLAHSHHLLIWTLRKGHLRYWIGTYLLVLAILRPSDITRLLSNHLLGLKHLPSHHRGNLSRVRLTHGLTAWSTSYLIRLLPLSLSSCSISLLSLLLFDIDLDAFLDVSLQFSALLSRQLVQFKFEDLIVVLVDAIAHNCNYALLLLCGNQANTVLQVSLLI